jgi:hypothetical protein
MLVDATFRSASGSSSSGGAVVLEANGNVISESMSLPLTGGWQSYESTTFNDIVLPAGMLEMKLRIIDGGSNLNYFTFSNPRSPAAVQFKSLFAETSVLGNKVFIHLNGEITAGNPGIEEFSMKIGTKDVSFTSVKVEEGSRLIELEPDEIMPTIGAMFVSYTGSSIEANGSTLLSFTDLRINNILYKYKTIPGKIQAEDYYFNNGFGLEECEDTGGGQNTAYSDNGDYMDYVVNVNEAKEYSINMRVALQNGSATIQFLYENEEGEYTMINNMTLSNTGGWQNWQTQTSTVELPEGKYRFRIKSLSGEHNINWFEFEDNVGIESLGLMPGVKVYPNPATDFIYVEWINEESIQATIELIDNLGRTVYKAALQDRISRISTDNLDGGIYIFRIKSQEGTSYSKVIIR